MDEHMLPNDGAYFSPREPAERVRAREVAKSKARAGKDTITEVLARLQARIAFYNSLDSIPADVLADPQRLGFHLAANRQTVANLGLELTHWQGVLKDS